MCSSSFLRFLKLNFCLLLNRTVFGGAYNKAIWSEKALRKFVSNKNIRKTNKKHDLFKHLRHEHIVTKEEVIKRIKNEPVIASAYLEILDKFAHAAVIDKDEEDDFKRAQCDRKTPDGYKEDIYIRYRLSNIKLCKGISKNNLDNLDEQNVEEFIRQKAFNF